MVSLRADGLRRKFDGSVALDGVSVTLSGPEIVGLDVGTVDDLWIAAVALVLFSELSILAADALIRRNE